jgi:tRNA modification GTPase
LRANWARVPLLTVSTRSILMGARGGGPFTVGRDGQVDLLRAGCTDWPAGTARRRRERTRPRTSSAGAAEGARLEVRPACARATRLDLFAEERLAQNQLASITGEFSADDLLGVIFSRFCIGK